MMSDVSIHVPRVEDDGDGKIRGGATGVSIHVPRVEDDGVVENQK